LKQSDDRKKANLTSDECNRKKKVSPWRRGELKIPKNI
jgi:hypothetical protein